MKEGQERAAPRYAAERIDDFRWRIRRQGAMRVDGLIFATEKLMQAIGGDQAEQEDRRLAREQQQHQRQDQQRRADPRSPRPHHGQRRQPGLWQIGF